MSDPVAPVARLSVKRSDLAEALRTLDAGADEEMSVRIRLTYRDGVLTMTGPFSAADLPADGDWPKLVVFSLSLPGAFSEKLSASEVLNLIFDGTRLTIGAISFPALTDTPEGAPVALPMDLTMMGLLECHEQYGLEAVQATLGFKEWERRFGQVYELIGEASEVLKPLGIDQTKLLFAMNLLARQSLADRGVTTLVARLKTQ